MIIIETTRLFLSELKIEDASFILKLYNDPDFITYIGDKGMKTLQDAEKFIKTGPIQSYIDHKHGLYLVQLKDNSPIGICGILKRDYLDFPDIGFAVLPKYRKKGFTFEASKSIIEDVKNNTLFKKILAITSPKNNASIRLLIKLGFIFKDIIKIEQNKNPVQLYTIHLDS